MLISSGKNEHHCLFLKGNTFFYHSWLMLTVVFLYMASVMLRQILTLLCLLFLKHELALSFSNAFSALVDITVCFSLFVLVCITLTSLCKTEPFLPVSVSPTWACCMILWFKQYCLLLRDLWIFISFLFSTFILLWSKKVHSFSKIPLVNWRTREHYRVGCPFYVSSI